MAASPRLKVSLLTQLGHERPAFAAMHGPDLLYLVRDTLGLAGNRMKRREFITLLGCGAGRVAARGR